MSFCVLDHLRWWSLSISAVYTTVLWNCSLRGMTWQWLRILQQFHYHRHCDKKTSWFSGARNTWCHIWYRRILSVWVTDVWKIVLTKCMKTMHLNWELIKYWLEFIGIICLYCSIIVLLPTKTSLGLNVNLDRVAKMFF